MTVLHISFWMSLGAVSAVYLLYPLALIVAPRRRRHAVDEKLTPTVSLVISAYNEVDVIREKIENSLALDYPAELLEIVIISDASDDGTDAVVEEYAERGVVLYRQEPREGKSIGLTRFIPRCKGDIIVFSDANSMYRADAVKLLVRHFCDASVGFVVGHQSYVDDDTAAGDSESLYWRYETMIKVHESRIGSIVGGDGAIYAMRAELFEPLRADDINDFYLPLRVVTRGFRGVFDREAVCYEKSAANFRGEFRRKVRIVSRSLLAVARVRAALDPRCVGLFAFQLFFHKVLRWLLPFFLIVMLLVSGILAYRGSALYSLLLLSQVAVYSLALFAVVPGANRLRAVSIACYFCIINLAAFMGVLNCICGRKIATWQPERAPIEQPAASPGT